MKSRPRTSRHILQSGSFYESIRPIFFFTFCCGLSQLLVTTNGRGENTVITPRYGWAWPMLHLGCYLMIAAHTTYYDHTFIKYFLQTNVSDFGSKLYVVGLMWASCVMVACGIGQKRQLVAAIKKVLVIDDKLKAIGMQANYTRLLRTTWLFCSVTCLLNTLAIGVYIWCLLRMDIAPSAFLIMNVLNEQVGVSFIYVLFLFTCQTLELRITAINKVSENRKQKFDN